MNRKNLKLGHTALSLLPLGLGPVFDLARLPYRRYVEESIKDISGPGFWGLEFLINQIEAIGNGADFGTVLNRDDLAFTSGYCAVNLTAPSERKSEIEKVSAWAKLLKNHGDSEMVVGPNLVQRDTYQFSESKGNMVAALNDAGGADPVKVVQNFLPIVRHMHLKDFSGGEQ